MKKRADRADVKTKVIGSLIMDECFSLVNISDSGALINTNQKLLLGNIYYLRFDFMEWGKKTSLKLKSKIVRETLKTFVNSGKGGKTAVYEVGLCFFGVSEEDVRKLKYFIAQKELKKVIQ